MQTFDSKFLESTFRFLPTSKSQKILEIPQQTKLSLQQIRQHLSSIEGNSSHHFALSQDTYEQLIKFDVLKHRTTRITFCNVCNVSNYANIMLNGIWLLYEEDTQIFKLKVSSTSGNGTAVSEITDQTLILQWLNVNTETSKKSIREHAEPVFRYWYDRYYYIISTDLELYVDVAQFKHNDYYILGTLKVMSNSADEQAERMLEALQVIPNARSKVAEGFACHRTALYNEMVAKGVLPEQRFVDQSIQHFQEHPYPDERKRDKEVYEYAISEFKEDTISSVDEKVDYAKIIIMDEDSDSEDEEFLLEGAITAYCDPK